MKPEPYRIKMVEPIYLIPENERIKYLQNAHYNLFKIPARAIYIDLLTDSGTGAMSSAQWSAMFLGDESYAYAESFFKFQEAIEDVLGFKYILPVHQGRGGERVFFSTILKKGDIVPSNSHFDTTRANIEALGAEAIDLLIPVANDLDAYYPFKGNMDVNRLEELLKKEYERIPCIMLTITNNTGGGQPVSLNNIKEISQIAKKYNKLFFIDACRFAENAYFIWEREEEYKNKSIKEIAREIFSYCDGCLMSAKKDAIANIGGFIATHHKNLYEKLKNMLILTEGFITYGGLAGRDLEAIAVGLKEAIQLDYLHSRIGQIRFLANLLSENNIPILKPAGGHAVYIDAKKFLPHIPQSQYPGQSLAVEIYKKGGIRCCEIGSVMFSKTDPSTGIITYPKFELVRLAIPRRVYTNSHLSYVADIMSKIWNRRHNLKGYKIIHAEPFLPHFTAAFEPL